MTLEPTRRNTHNAPPDLRRKIARPSSNRLSHMHLSLADRYLGEPDYGLVGYRKLEHNLHVGRTKFYLNPSVKTVLFLVWHLDNLLAQVGRTLLGLFSHHWRREFFWHLDNLSAQIGRILLGRVYGRRHGATHITRRPTCAGREIARPSCNRFGNLEKSQQVQTRITFWFFFVQQWNNPCWKGYCMGFPNLLSFFWIWCI